MTESPFVEVYIPALLAVYYARQSGDSGKLLARLLMEGIAAEVHLGHRPNGAVILRLFPALGVTLDQIVTAAGVPRGSSCTLCRLRVN